MADCSSCSPDPQGYHQPGCQRAQSLGLPVQGWRGEVDESKPLPPSLAYLEPPPAPPPSQIATGAPGAPPSIPLAVVQRAAEERREAEAVEKLCVGCGNHHASEEDEQIGVARIAASCKWRLKYPGMEAHEVIALLEGQVSTALGGSS